MNFRHLLEMHQVDRQRFDTINQWLCEADSLVDTSIIEAPRVDQMILAWDTYIVEKCEVGPGNG
ncbi:hypothetical protein WP5W18E02_09590 [Aeromonas caviae]|nr:hypothetical protein WP5W18E02_09590 [Aeromonas caviae]